MICLTGLSLRLKLPIRPGNSGLTPARGDLAIHPFGADKMSSMEFTLSVSHSLKLRFCQLSVDGEEPLVLFI